LTAAVLECVSVPDPNTLHLSIDQIHQFNQTSICISQHQSSSSPLPLQVWASIVAAAASATSPSALASRISRIKLASSLPMVKATDTLTQELKLLVPRVTRVVSVLSIRVVHPGPRETRLVTSRRSSTTGVHFAAVFRHRKETMSMMGS
jgi:hypothetical protein